MPPRSRARGDQGWKDTRQDAGEKCSAEGGGNHQAIHPHVRSPQETRREDPCEKIRPPPCQEESEAPRNESQGQCFGQELPGKAASTGTERNPNGHLCSPAQVPGYQKPSDICAGQEKDQACDPQEDPQPTG